jgi:hypothetical protein
MNSYFAKPQFYRESTGKVNSRQPQKIALFFKAGHLKLIKLQNIYA